MLLLSCWAMHKRPQCDAVDLSCDLSTFVSCISCTQSSAGLFCSCIRQKQQGDLLKTRLHVMLTHSICVLYHQKILPLLHAGKCAQIQVLPDSNTAGQQHMACKLLHSSKQAAFVFFYRVLEGGGRGAVLTPGTLEWTLVQEVKLGEEKSMMWTLPGALWKTRSLGASGHS